MTAKDHNNLLGIFFMINGGIQLLAGIFVALLYGGMGTIFIASGREEQAAVGGIFLVLAIIVGLIVLAFGAFYVVTGLKLRKGASIARPLGIAASCLCLLGFPLGTALGVYGLWFLFGDLGKNFYAGNTAPQNYYQPQPPPPSSWQ